MSAILLVLALIALGVALVDLHREAVRAWVSRAPYRLRMAFFAVRTRAWERRHRKALKVWSSSVVPKDTSRWMLRRPPAPVESMERALAMRLHHAQSPKDKAFVASLYDGTYRRGGLQ